MIRHRLAPLLALGIAALLATGCPKKDSTTPAPKADPDAAVQAGNGWTRVRPGVWQFSIDGDKSPDMGLTAFGKGAGMERIELPAGAKKANLAAMSVAYVEAGDATWTVYADANNAVGAESTKRDVSVSDAGAKGQPAKWTEHPIGTPVAGPFWLVFTVRSGSPAVGALNGVDSGRLQYRAAPDQAGKPVPHLPFVRVMLTDVE